MYNPASWDHRAEITSRSATSCGTMADLLNALTV